jgi:hypothetical protein
MFLSMVCALGRHGEAEDVVGFSHHLVHRGGCALTTGEPVPTP